MVGTNMGSMVVNADTTVTATIRKCRRLEIFGYVDGDVIAEEIVVHPGGQLYGTIRAGQADIHGAVQGDVIVRNLIAIRAGGSVTGNVQYGRLALEDGGNLAAELRNVPPRLVGDFSVTVARGKAVRVTTLDVAAVDPDNAPAELTYAVSNETGGHIAFAEASAERLQQFSQADLNQGRVMFVHDGSPARTARFDVVVTDSQGATSGRPRSVDVVVV